MSEIKIVPVELKDLSKLQAISRETFAKTFDEGTAEDDMKKFLDEAYSSEKLTKELNNPNSKFWFITVDDQVAGYLKLNVENAQTEHLAENALEVERIYLSDRFQHMGLGLKLMQFAEEKARKLNKDAMWLGVWEHNENAKHFYARYGYKRVSEHTFVVGDDKQTDYLLLKKLN